MSLSKNLPVRGEMEADELAASRTYRALTVDTYKQLGRCLGIRPADQKSIETQVFEAAIPVIVEFLSSKISLDCPGAETQMLHKAASDTATRLCDTATNTGACKL